MKARIVIPATKLRLFQDLVKKHDLRFDGDPIVIGMKAIVNIDGDHLPIERVNQFFANWNNLTTPVVEKTTPRWKQKLRGLGLKIK